MRIISLRKLREFWQNPKYSDSEIELKVWYDVAKNADWTCFNDVKLAFGARVDRAHGKYVFDVCGNKYRLVCAIDFTRHGVLTLWLNTHKEYDKLNAKNGKLMKEL